MTLLRSTSCSILPVRELHGRTPKTQLEQALAPAESICPDDVVALRQVGCMMDNIPVIAGTTFIMKTANGSGFAEYRLCETPSALKPRLMQCVGAIDDDWELFQEFPVPFLEPGEDGPTWFEMIHCRGALMFIWLDKLRMFGMSPGLLSTTSVPAALFIEKDDLSGTDLGDQGLVAARIALCERLSGVPIERPALA